MSAFDYPVTLPYGAKTAPYSPSKPHRGNDRACPTGTLVTIGNTTIGSTGASGLATGPHLHTQAGTDEWCQSTVDPTPYEFKPGTVVHIGYADQWGNYVIVKVGSQYICYAHLSAIKVKVGQVIEGGNTVKPTEAEVYETFRLFLGYDPKDQNEVQYYLDRDKRELYYEVLFNGLRPKKADVELAFAELHPNAPVNADQLEYYPQHDWGWLYKDLAYNLKKLLAEAEAGSYEPYNGPPLFTKKK